MLRIQIACCIMLRIQIAYDSNWEPVSVSPSFPHRILNDIMQYDEHIFIAFSQAIDRSKNV